MRNKQMTLAGSGFEKYAKATRRAQFLAEMERVVHWGELCALIEPVYPKGEGGRPAVPLERMLRIHFLQHRFNLSDPAVEEALYDSASMRALAGIDLASEPVPDETTVLQEVERYLQRQGSVAATAANVADGNMIGELLHGKETHVWGDAVYSGRTERIRANAPKAKDFTQRRGRGYRYLSDCDRWINRARSRVRAPRRALDWGHEARVRLRQGALPRHREERHIACSSPVRWRISSSPAITCSDLKKRSASKNSKAAQNRAKSGAKALPFPLNWRLCGRLASMRAHVVTTSDVP